MHVIVNQDYLSGKFGAALYFRDSDETPLIAVVAEFDSPEEARAAISRYTQALSRAVAARSRDR